MNLKPISIRNQFKKVTCYSGAFLSSFPVPILLLRVKKNKKKSKKENKCPSSRGWMLLLSRVFYSFYFCSLSPSLLFSDRAIQPTYPWLPSPEKPIDSSLCSFKGNFSSKNLLLAFSPPSFFFFLFLSRFFLILSRLLYTDGLIFYHQLK